jgi:hypothetical protein
MMRRHLEDDILSYFKVKKLVAEISGVTSIVRDMHGVLNECSNHSVLMPLCAVHGMSEKSEQPYKATVCKEKWRGQL